MVISRSKTDFTASVDKALAEIDPDYMSYHGIVITGSHAPLDVDQKLELTTLARTQNVPFLGICMGMQIMLIEAARNLLGLVNAHTQEIAPHTPEPVVVKMPKLRVGIYPVRVSGRDNLESHWHQYKFNEEYTEQLEQKDFEFVFTDDVAEIVYLKGHPFFFGVQWHPEYQSSKDQPHSLLVKFLDICRQSTVASLRV